MPQEQDDENEHTFSNYPELFLVMVSRQHNSVSWMTLVFEDLSMLRVGLGTSDGI